jgi:TRAP-type mannitol/chloroaromatic compound transport system permease large subunit
MKKELYFGLSLIVLILASIAIFMPAPWNMSNGHLGLLMLSLVVVAIMLGFPTAFTLMGMGVIFTFLAYDKDPNKTLDLMVQSTYKVMTNDVLISIPLFVFMGYLVERANLIEKLFKSLHLSMARLPGALAVATLVTCAIFATATGIVGAVVTLMGLLAMPSMMKAGYDTKMAAGAITAGGCLGILIPPSVMLIVYGATAGVSVVKLYAGAFFPGIMLAVLYIAYVIIRAKINPKCAPPLSEEDRKVHLSPVLADLASKTRSKALPALIGALKGSYNTNQTTGAIFSQFLVTVSPLVVFLAIFAASYTTVTAPLPVEESFPEMQAFGSLESADKLAEPGGLQEPPGASSTGLQEPPGALSSLQEPPGSSSGLQEPPGAVSVAKEPASGPSGMTELPVASADAAIPEPRSASNNFWIGWGIAALLIFGFYAKFTIERLEIFKMLLASFFPLAFLILAVLGCIVFGLATPTEAAAVGAGGGLILAALYKQLNLNVVQESAFLTAKTSAMVCWLFVGSSIFSAAFALLGGQELIEQWVLSLGLTKLQFLILSQVIIFVLGWPLEWTEIIVIFMPIFIPLLSYFEIDPLFFGLLVALNLQTAFLSPPVAMAAFYLKGVSPPGVTLNQIFAGMMPFMGIQILALVLLYIFPEIGMWLPETLYK